jgi:short-subunit dehydrogenase
MISLNPRPLSEQVIVITGASSGIGLATAKLAAKEGAKVVINARNSNELGRIAREIGDTVIAAPGDVSVYEDIMKIKDTALENFGRIDTWINNAGVAIYGDLQNANFEDERKLFEINYWGTRMASDVALKELSKNGGSLINVGSELSELSPPVLGAYAASKHAIKAFTDSLRIEIQSKKLPVNVTLIRPTSIATPMPEHGTNDLQEGEPSLPSFLYHPDVVATMILRCAVKPKRDMFVGIQARISSIASTLFPEITDSIAKFRTSEMKQGISPTHKKEKENLEKAPNQEGKVKGNYNRHIIRRSIYSDLATLGVKGTIKNYLSSNGKLM